MVAVNEALRVEVTKIPVVALLIVRMGKLTTDQWPLFLIAKVIFQKLRRQA